MSDPSCHACGSPIELGEPVAVYHEGCEGNRRETPGKAVMTDEDLDFAIDEIASDAFEDLCTGDGEHSEQLDRNLLRKHLRRAVDLILGRLHETEQRVARLEAESTEMQKDVDFWTREAAHEAKRRMQAEGRIQQLEAENAKRDQLISELRHALKSAESHVDRLHGEKAALREQLRKAVEFGLQLGVESMRCNQPQTFASAWDAYQRQEQREADPTQQPKTLAEMSDREILHAMRDRRLDNI